MKSFNLSKELIRPLYRRKALMLKTLMQKVQGKVAKEEFFSGLFLFYYSIKLQ